MKVIFHPRFYEVYTSDPAAAPGRMEPMVKALEREYEFVEPGPASERTVTAGGRTAVRGTVLPQPGKRE